MKKLLTTLSTVALASALAIPVFARPKSSKAPKAQATAATAVHNKKAKSHTKHASKRGTTKKATMGQQAPNPAPTK
jgi:acid phosphatase class B